MPRITPLPEPEWRDVSAILEAQPPGLRSRLGDNNIFPTLARHPDLFRAWLPFGGFLLGGGVLGPRERELLILRTGHNCGSRLRVGPARANRRRAGMTREQIGAVAAGPGATGLSAEDSLLLAAADELHADAKISDDTWALLAEGRDERALIEIAMLVGHYHMVAYALNSLEVELDEGLESLPASA